MLNLTVFGREVRAIGGGERIAFLTGIKVERVKIAIFGLVGLLCGMAGLLQAARSMAATAQLGEGLELDAIAAVVVGGTPLTGGVGSVQGTILGALIITILSNGMNIMGLDPYFQNIVKGLVLILSVFITIDRKKIGIIKWNAGRSAAGARASGARGRIPDSPSGRALPRRAPTPNRRCRRRLALLRYWSMCPVTPRAPTQWL